VLAGIVYFTGINVICRYIGCAFVSKSTMIPSDLQWKLSVIPVFRAQKACRRGLAGDRDIVATVGLDIFVELFYLRCNHQDGESTVG
jgi:hypothetical protein